jgi:signal transduction histidine kinase
MAIDPLRSAVLSLALLGLVGAAGAARPTPGAAVPNAAFDRNVVAAKRSMMSEPQKAYASAKAALALTMTMPAGRQQDLEHATATWLMAEALTRTKHPEQALPILDQALAVVVEAAPETRLHGDLLKSRGHAAASLGHVQAALQDFQNAYKIYKHANEPRSEAIALQEIGSIYSDARDYPHELQYYAQARETFAQDPALALTADNNRGFALKSMGQLPQAEAEFRNALAVAYQLKSGALKAQILANIGFTEALEGKSSAAWADARRGLALVDSDPEARSEKPFLMGVLAKVAADRGDHPAAAGLLDQVFAGADLASTQMEYKDFHELAANVYEAVGDRGKALQHLKAFKRLDDQGRALAASTNAALMAAKFDFANQATKIAELKVNQVQSRSRFIAAIVGILAVGALVVISLITHAFFTMRRSRNRIQAVNTELESANTSLEKALKAKTEFLATTSHEIRTPLNGILGMTEVMLADRRISNEMRERLGLLKAAGDTMNAMVSDLLDVAKIENGGLTVCKAELNLARLLDDAAKVWRDQAHTKGLDFRLDLAGCPARIVEDGDRLRQVLFNLLSNAVKFTDHGEVSLSARTVVRDGGERLMISVTDSGTGIPSDQFERIFDSFTQVDSSTERRYGGTGLGLTICRNIAGALGGAVTVESTPGVGSTFSVDLPLQWAPECAAPIDAAEQQGLAKVSLLIVDDNPLAQAMIRAVMIDKVRRLDFADGLDAAIESLNSRAFDRVLVDGAFFQRQFPDDPFAEVAKLARLGIAPVCALWPSPTSEDLSRLSAAGVVQVIGKPIAAAALVKALEDGLDAPSAGLQAAWREAV